MSCSHFLRYDTFLHGGLNEEVYTSLPPGYDFAGSNKVCKLNKSLYGLKQTNRKCHTKLSATLLSLGCTQSEAGHSIYTKHTSHSFTTLLVYVDDIVLTGDSLMGINNVKAFLHNRFHIKDLGAVILLWP